MADTLDDLLEQWRIHGGWKPSKADFQRLVDEIERLRAEGTETWDRAWMAGYGSAKAELNPNPAPCACDELGTLMCPVHNVGATDA